MLQTYSEKSTYYIFLFFTDKRPLKYGSGALSGKVLLVRIVAYNKNLAYFEAG